MHSNIRLFLALGALVLLIGHSPVVLNGRQAPVIQLAVDAWDGDPAKLSFLATGADTKAAWGVRLTLAQGQRPFTLTGVAALIATDPDGGGLAPGDPIEIVILADANESEIPANAVVVHRQSDTVKASNNGIGIYTLTTPVTAAQGDLYLVIVDRTTDEDGTVIPYYDGLKGAPRTDRSLVARSAPAVVGKGFSRIDAFPTGGEMAVGNFVVRGIGMRAVPGTRVTGTFQPVNESLPKITDLIASSREGAVVLRWSSPVFDLPTPVGTAEREPNDSPERAQPVEANVVVSGRARSSDRGGPGGFCVDSVCDDVEDYYAFTLASPSPVTLSLTDFGLTDFDLLLYRAEGPFDPQMDVGQSGASAGVPELIEIDLLPAGSYVVAVTAYDPAVPNFTDYRLQITAAPRPLFYNVFCAVSQVTQAPENFIGTAGPDTEEFVVESSPIGARYSVSAVVGAEQTGVSNTSECRACCEGGPTFTGASVKRAGEGKLIVTGLGFTPEVRAIINGNELPQGKVRKQGTVLKLKGPLPNGQSINSALVPGSQVTLTFLTPSGGCTTVIYNVEP